MLSAVLPDLYSWLFKFWLTLNTRLYLNKYNMSAVALTTFHQTSKTMSSNTLKRGITLYLYCCCCFALSMWFLVLVKGDKHWRKAKSDFTCRKLVTKRDQHVTVMPAMEKPLPCVTLLMEGTQNVHFQYFSLMFYSIECL